jgi:hypothetical protein
MNVIVCFISVFTILPVCIISTGYDPDYRPSGLPTYTPPSTSDFDVTVFTAWVWNQSSLGISEVAVAYGTWPVFPSGVYGSIYPFSFTNLNNFIMWFDNVKLVFQNYTQAGFVFASCSNVTLHGLTTVYSEPTFSQAVVTNITVSPTNNQIIWVDVEICSGYPNRFMLNQASISGYIFNGTTLLAYEPSKMSEVYFISTSQNLTNDGSKLRFLLSIDYVTSGSLNVGDYITARGYFTQFFYAANSALISYIDVTILNCGGYGFFTYGGVGGHVYRRIRITYAPPPSVTGAVPTLITCSADGLHYIAAEQGPTIQNSLFEGTQDDAIAIHGLYGNVTNVDYASGQFRITVTYNYLYLVGDTLRIYTSVYVPRGYATVSAVQQEADGSMNVTLIGSIINSIQIDDIVTDISHQSNGFLIENNLIRWHRARAMLIKASNGIIRNNIVNGSSIGGIHIKPEPLTEADYGQNVIVEGNWVSDSGFFYGWGSICVFTILPNSNTYPLAGGFVNILISNNTILRSYRDNILVTSAMNVTVINNQIVGPLYSPYAAVNLANVNGVTLVNNVVYQANPATTVLLQMSSVVNPQGNITAGVYFNQTSNGPTLPNWPGLMDASTPTNPSATALSASDARKFFRFEHLCVMIGSFLCVFGAVTGRY